MVHVKKGVSELPEVRRLRQDQFKSEAGPLIIAEEILAAESWGLWLQEEYSNIKFSHKLTIIDGLIGLIIPVR